MPSQRRKLADEFRPEQRGDAYEGPDPKEPLQLERGERQSIDLIISPNGANWPDPPAKEAFHGLAGDVVKRIEPETEADPVGILVQYLTAFGNAAGRTAFCPVGRRRHHGNLYCVLVGKTSYGGKGEAWAWVQSLMAGAVPDWSGDSIMGGLSSGEGLIKWAQDVREEAGRRVMAVEEEFGAVLRVIGREHSTLSAVLRQGWDGGRLRVATRNNPLKVDDAHISLVGHVTPEELAAELRSNESSNGFANRILWVCVRRSKLLPEGGERVDLADLEMNTQDAIRFAHNTQYIGRTEAARSLWHKVYEVLRAERPGLLGFIVTRAAAQVLRLSLIYALLDQSRQIEVVHLQAALALWNYCERSVRNVFGESSGDKLADQILDALKAAEHWLSQSDIQDLLGRHKSAADIARALGLLQSIGQAICEKMPTAGRPLLRWKYAKKAK